MTYPKVHQQLAGTVDIVNLGTYLYEGTERDWNLFGFTPEQSLEFTRANGTLFELKLYHQLLGKFPNGEDRYVVGVGRSLEEALESGKFQAICDYAVKHFKAHGCE